MMHDMMNMWIILIHILNLCCCITVLGY